MTALGSRVADRRRRAGAMSRWTILATLVLILVGLRPNPAAAEDRAPAPPTTAGGAYAAVVPAQRAEVRAATEAAALRYTIDARLYPEEGFVAGDLRLDFVNATPDELHEVYFRLIPNMVYDYGSYADAPTAMTLTALQVGDRTYVDPESFRSAAGSAVRAPLESALEPGDAVTIRLGYRLSVGSNGSGYGLDGLPLDDGWMLVDWYPMIADYWSPSGWQLDSSLLWGGYTRAGVALYDVTLTVPADLTLAANGRVVEEEVRGDLVSRRYVAGPVHEFVAVLDADLRSFQQEVGGTTVAVYVEADRAPGGRAALELATRTLAAYGERFGAYPRTDLVLVETPLAFAAGVAFDGLILFDARSLGGRDFLGWFGDDLTEAERGWLERLVAHEVGHQWWGSVIASDYEVHAFMVEGLTEYLSVVYVGWAHGEAAAERMLIAEVAGPYVEVMGYSGDAVADYSAVDGDEWAGYAPAYVYGKAALGFHAIRQEIGDDAFFAALHAYAEEHAFGFSAPYDLRRAFEAAADDDIGDVWRFWFEDDSTTVDDVRALIRAA